MFLLDTNVVSELMRRSPDPAVETWVARHALETLFFLAVGAAELRYGVAVMPEGRRRDTLASDIETMLLAAFENRVLPFDSDAACAYASITAVRRLSGRPVALANCLDRSHHTLPRHDCGDAELRDFSDMGIDVINPWEGV